jgi:hypothetical protein
VSFFADVNQPEPVHETSRRAIGRNVKLEQAENPVSKILFSSALGISLTIGCVAVYGDDSLSDEGLLNAVASLNQLVRVTENPVRMQPAAGTLCLPPGAQNHADFIPVRPWSGDRTPSARGSVPQPFMHVYVSQDGIHTMRAKESALFPVGTLILKRKFADESAGETVLYTGMLKRDKDYNTACGDWEFFTISGDGKTITARGRIESCITCHKRYSQSDFVTKLYPMRSGGPVLR